MDDEMHLVNEQREWFVEIESILVRMLRRLSNDNKGFRICKCIW